MKHLATFTNFQKPRMLSFILVFLLGFFIGLLAHDALLQHVDTSLDIKSWYPR